MLIRQYSDLSNNAQKLLDFLLETPDLWVSQEDICTNLPNEFKAKIPKKGSCICRDIWTAVNEINEKTNIEVLINKRRYKIATKEEAIQALQKLWYNSIQPKIDRVNRLKEKINTDGRGDLISFFNGDGNRFNDNFLNENDIEIYEE